MITLENIKGSLDGNNNFTDEVRDNIYGLTNVFQERYPEISLENLDRCLKTLKITKSNKFVNKRISKYNPLTNVLEFNKSEMEKDYDMRHVMMYHLLEMITNNGEQVGFNKNDMFKALHAGYTEILTNYLIGNEGDNDYLHNEIITTNMIALLVGNDVLFDSYFHNDTEALIKSLMNEGVELNAKLN